MKKLIVIPHYISAKNNKILYYSPSYQYNEQRKLSLVHIVYVKGNRKLSLVSMISVQGTTIIDISPHNISIRKEENCHYSPTYFCMGKYNNIHHYNYATNKIFVFIPHRRGYRTTTMSIVAIKSVKPKNLLCV